MCDIYGEPCKRCGKMVPMHLGDFVTSRTEVFVVCQDCMEGEYNPTNTFTMKNFNAVLWKNERDLWEKDTTMRNNPTGEFDYVLVVSLTENAWKNREMNHPNIAPNEILLIVPAKVTRRKENATE